MLGLNVLLEGIFSHGLAANSTEVGAIFRSQNILIEILWSGDEAYIWWMRAGALKHLKLS